MSELTRAEPQINCKELAEHCFKYNHELVNRLFMSIPKTFHIPDENSKKLVAFNKPDYCKGVMDLLGKINDSQQAILKPHLIYLISERIKEEVVNKKIPMEVFQRGAISFGFCDKIAYFGSYFLDMCDFRAIHLGLKRIAWSKVKIKVFVNQIEMIINKQNELDLSVDNIDRIVSINPYKIANWPSYMPHSPLLYDRTLFPFAITSSVAEYEEENITATWDLDFSSLKRDYKDPNKITNVYAARPLQIANIRAQKALVKQFYGGDLSMKIGVNDGGEDDPLILLNENMEYNLPVIPDAKMSFVEEKLSAIGD